MSDPRSILQATFDSSKRFVNYGEAILQMQIKGFRTHVDTLINIESPITAFCGVNGTGKSTILQLASAAYQQVVGRFYVSTFILAGTLDAKPFRDDASVEITYAEPPASDGRHPVRRLTISRSGHSWSGYDRQPSRLVVYLGSGFFIPHSERDRKSQAIFSDYTFRVQYKIALQATIIEQVSKILLCKYDAAHQNSLRKKYARRSMSAVTTKRVSGIEYSEANMGTGEARLYALVAKIESMPEKSLVLIEEPEIALHPCAQHELGKYLVEVAQRRKIQIMLTTHSEYLLLALPQKSRIYLKRDDGKIVPIPGIGVRQAVSMMDDWAIPAMYILVEDDVGEAIVRELLRKHDPDLLRATKLVVSGDKSRIQQMLDVFRDQKLPICAVRDADFGANPKLKMYKLFGSKAPEKEMFESASMRKHFADHLKVDWDAVDIANQGKDHHLWFDELERRTAMKRGEILPLAARAYLEGIPEADRRLLLDDIKASDS